MWIDWSLFQFPCRFESTLVVKIWLTGGEFDSATFRFNNWNCWKQTGPSRHATLAHYICTLKTCPSTWLTVDFFLFWKFHFFPSAVERSDSLWEQPGWGRPTVPHSVPRCSLSLCLHISQCHFDLPTSWKHIFIDWIELLGTEKNPRTKKKQSTVETQLLCIISAR